MAGGAVEDSLFSPPPRTAYSRNTPCPEAASGERILRPLVMILQANINGVVTVESRRKLNTWPETWEC